MKFRWLVSVGKAQSTFFNYNLLLNKVLRNIYLQDSIVNYAKQVDNSILSNGLQYSKNIRVVNYKKVRKSTNPWIGEIQNTNCSNAIFLQINTVDGISPTTLQLIWFSFTYYL